MLTERNEEERVCAALKDHTLLEVIAAAADVPVKQAQGILEKLARDGIAERYTTDAWGLRA